jgi:hypothetical protein
MWLLQDCPTACLTQRTHQRPAFFQQKRLECQRVANEAASRILCSWPVFPNVEKSLSKSDLPTQFQQGLDDDLAYENSDEINSKFDSNASAKQAATNTAAMFFAPFGQRLVVRAGAPAHQGYLHQAFCRVN